MPDALLAAVRADPDSDLPRLIYADYLDDTGDPDRAAYIRAAVEDATLADDSPRRRELAFRCRELLDANLDTWGTGVADHGGFERGFVTVAACDGDPDALADAFDHPLRRLWVQPVGDVRSLAHLPVDNRLTTLDLTGNRLTAADLCRLARVRQFPHLDTLVLSLCGLDDEAAAVLDDLGFFAGLKVLEVGGNPFTDAGIQRLFGVSGRQVLFACQRHPGHLYALGDDYLTVGFAPDHLQVVLFATLEAVTAFRFDHAGRLLDRLARPVPPGPGQPWDRAAAVRAEVSAELRIEPATVRLRRFAAGGLEVADYPATMIEDWDAVETADGAWDEAAVGRWLADGQWVLDFGGDDYWVDGNGIVTDT